MKRIVVGIHEAKTQFSKLVKQAEAGQEIVVENFQFGPKSQNQSERSEERAPAEEASQEENINVDDIPF